MLLFFYMNICEKFYYKNANIGRLKKTKATVSRAMPWWTSDIVAGFIRDAQDRQQDRPTVDTVQVSHVGTHPCKDRQNRIYFSCLGIKRELLSSSTMPFLTQGTELHWVPLVSTQSIWQSRRGHSWESKHPLLTCGFQLMINSSQPSVNHVWVQLAETGLFKALWAPCENIFHYKWGFPCRHQQDHICFILG